MPIQNSGASPTRRRAPHQTDDTTPRTAKRDYQGFDSIPIEAVRAVRSPLECWNFIGGVSWNHSLQEQYDEHLHGGQNPGDSPHVFQKTEDRRSDLHIYASDRANVQIINGNDNNTSGSHNRTAHGISHPIVAQPKPFWQKLIAPIAVSVATAVLLLLWILGFDPKWIALFGLPLLAGGVVYLVILQREMVARTWARRNAAWCLAIAGASLMAPGVELLVELKPGSKIKFVLDNTPWAGIVFLVAACIFGWLQYKMDARQEASGMSSS